jgi:hypothetical protein
MKKFTALLIGALLSLGPAAVAQTTGMVTFEIRTSLGLPVEDGSATLTNQFDQVGKDVIDGKVEFEVPFGARRFSLRALADMNSDNTHATYLNLIANISGRSVVVVTLPPVVRSKINISTGISNPPETMAMGLASYREGMTLQWGTLTDNLVVSTWQVSVNGQSQSVKVRAGQIQHFRQDSDGQTLFNLREDNVAGGKSMKISDGSINFAVFTPSPLASHEPYMYSTPNRYDFDNDGFIDYFFSYKFGSGGPGIVGRISHAEFFSGNFTLPIDGAVSIQVDDYVSHATAVRNNNRDSSFKLSGSVESESALFTSVNSPVKAYVLGYRAYARGYRFSDAPYWMPVGSAALNPDGTFEMLVTINRSQELVSNEFLLSTPLGYGTRNFTLPSLEGPELVSQKTLATFQGSATGLTSQQMSQVKAAVEANPNAEKFICTGIRYYSQPMNVNIMVRERAKAACDYAKELNPSLSTWYQNKPTQARSYAGKVLLTVKSPSQ